MSTSRTALVTGAFGGLGTAITQRLANAGVPVIACDRRAEDMAAWHASLPTSARDQVRPHAMDITRDTEVDELRDTLAAENIEISYLINNAGVTGIGAPWTMPTKTFDIVTRVNLYGTFFLTRAFVESMKREKFGRIVNFASLYAYQPGPGQAPYAAAKAGIVGYTHSIATDLAPHGITANVIAPGLIWHERLQGVLPESEFENMREQTPAKRAGKPEEIAATVEFLLSEDAGFMTGQTLHVNGGVFMPG